MSEEIIEKKKPDYKGNPKGVGRPRGAKDLKPRITARRRLTNYLPDEILTYKLKILEMLEKGQARTLTQCAEILEIPAVRVHGWSASDKDFQEMIRLVREIIADKIEAEFSTHANFIPKMMLLKAYRPMFKDNFRLDVTNTRLEEMLNELKKLN